MLVNVSDALMNLAPWVLILAAVGAAAAGVTGRRRFTFVLLGVAALAVVVPIVVGAWWVISPPFRLLAIVTR